VDADRGCAAHDFGAARRSACTSREANPAMTPEIWRYIFDAIEDPVFLHDEQYRLLPANRAYCHEAGRAKTGYLRMTEKIGRDGAMPERW
jgi:hypothetical protein